MSANVQSMQMLQVQQQLPPLDPNQRYTIPEAIAYLRTSRKSLYAMIARGELKTIEVGDRAMLEQRRDGATSRSRLAGRKVASRRWVPGSELVRLSQAPA